MSIQAQQALIIGPKSDSRIALQQALACCRVRRPSSTWRRKMQQLLDSSVAQNYDDGKQLVLRAAKFVDGLAEALDEGGKV